MSTAKLTSKGQVTIPKNIREVLHLQTGDELEFVIVTEGEVVIRPVIYKVEDVFGQLHKPSQKSVSIEEMDEAIRQHLLHSRLIPVEKASAQSRIAGLHQGAIWISDDFDESLSDELC